METHDKHIVIPGEHQSRIYPRLAFKTLKSAKADLSCETRNPVTFSDNDFASGVTGLPGLAASTARVARRTRRPGNDEGGSLVLA